jgi:hypothetical protein
VSTTRATNELNFDIDILILFRSYWVVVYIYSMNFSKTFISGCRKIDYSYNSFVTSVIVTGVRIIGGVMESMKITGVVTPRQ